jgi:hypothetical protein
MGRKPNTARSRAANFPIYWNLAMNTKQFFLSLIRRAAHECGLLYAREGAGGKVSIYGELHVKGGDNVGVSIDYDFDFSTMEKVFLPMGKDAEKILVEDLKAAFQSNPIYQSASKIAAAY